MSLRPAVIALTAAIMAAPAAAAPDHGCGEIPQTPAHFDPDAATREDVLETKAAFEAYQARNTAFVECLKAFSASATVQRMDRKERKATIDAMEAQIKVVDDMEAAYADRFNANAQTWMASRKKPG